MWIRSLVLILASIAIFPLRATAQDVVEETPEDTAPAATAPQLPARTTFPAALPLRLPHQEAGLAIGVSQVGNGVDDLTSVSFAPYLETKSSDELFGIRLQLPVAYADSVLVGDFDLDLGWLVWRQVEPEKASYLSLGLDLTFPTGLLNTLGGGAGEIRARRLSNYPTVSRLNLLPIRYFQMLAHVGFAQRIGKLLLFVDLGGMFVLANRFPNYYDSPNPEVALQYGLGAAYELYAAEDGNTSLGAGLELSGTHFFTQVAPTLDNEVGGTIAPEPREDRDSGLSIAPSFRAVFAGRVSLVAGAMIGLLNEQTFSRFTPSTLWQHDFTFFLEAGFILD